MIKGYFYDKKNTVTIVVLPMSNNMERPSKISKDTGVKAASKLSSGDDLMPYDPMNDIGLSYGSKKATQSGNYAISRVTVSLNSNTLRIIGSNNYLMNSLIILNTNI